jgi:hypothetical protein
LCLLGVVAFTALDSVRAWNSETHLIIARIAYEILEHEDPDALDRADDLLRKYSDDITKAKEGDYPFVEGVTLADDNKRRGGGYQSSWHFNDLGFSGDGGEYNFKATPKNISLAMPEIYNWLMGKDVSQSIIIPSIIKRTDTTESAQGLGLRLLMHYMGDIHQPLHMVSRYTAEFPNGDKGGNLFDLKYHYNANELHAVFDNVMYSYRKTIKRPFTKDGWDDFTSIAMDLFE